MTQTQSPPSPSLPLPTPILSSNWQVSIHPYLWLQWCVQFTLTYNTKEDVLVGSWIDRRMARWIGMGENKVKCLLYHLVVGLYLMYNSFHFSTCLKIFIVWWEKNKFLKGENLIGPGLVSSRPGNLLAGCFLVKKFVPGPISHSHGSKKPHETKGCPLKGPYYARLLPLNMPPYQV